MTIGIHPTATVADSVRVGEGATIWHHAHVMEGAVLGDGVMLGHAVFVGKNVRIGARCRVQNHVSVFEGVTLEEDVFVGPSATFTNVKRPRAFSRTRDFEETHVGRGATIGANATILPGLRIGAYAFVGAGAVVTKDVAAFTLVVGSPAVFAGHVARSGARLDFDASGCAACAETGERYRLSGTSVELVDE